MASNALFLRAKALHLGGSFLEAENLYLHVLMENPADAEGLHLLGLLHADTNRLESGMQLVRAAIDIDGPKPWLCRNLGIILDRSGNKAAAIACYRQALATTPRDQELQISLATLLDAEERHAEAAVVWRTAFESSSCTPSRLRMCRLAWANSLALAGDRAAAIDQYDILLAAEPQDLEALFHRSIAYMQENKRDMAMDGFRQTLALAPGHAQAANNLGILEQLGRNYPEAIAQYQAAIRFDPGYDAALYNLGSAWQESGRPDAARCVFRKVLKKQPDHAAAWTNLGNAWLASNKTESAIACYRKTLYITPDEPAAEWNLGIVSLLTGDWAAGWRGYERRFDVSGATPRRPFLSPLWRGESIAGKSVLLHAEQGLGDTIQFIRYAPLLAERGGRVHVECQPALIPLFNEMQGVIEWYSSIHQSPGQSGSAEVAHLPRTDFQLPLLSAPAVLGTTPGTVPLPNGYLQAPMAARRRWRKWLGPKGRRRRVGICWAGNPNHKNDGNRSIPPEMLAELEDVSLVDWISLQRGHRLPSSPEMRNAARELRDFADTAGLVANLDLVVSVDTSVAHLAGALGKPVWILLPYAPDWRWQLEGETSQWYSSARLFRQQEAGRWRPVLQEVSRAIQQAG